MDFFVVAPSATYIFVFVLFCFFFGGVKSLNVFFFFFFEEKDWK